jgi:hypothetical protein
MVCEESQFNSRRWFPCQSMRMAQFDTLYTEGAKTRVSYESCCKFVHSGKQVVYYHIVRAPRDFLVMANFLPFSYHKILATCTIRHPSPQHYLDYSVLNSVACLYINCHIALSNHVFLSNKYAHTAADQSVGQYASADVSDCTT